MSLQMRGLCTHVQSSSNWGSDLFDMILGPKY